MSSSSKSYAPKLNHSTPNRKTARFSPSPVVQTKKETKKDSKDSKDSALPQWQPSAENWQAGNSTSPAALYGHQAPVQAKLTIGEVGDKYEQEAEQVSKNVVEQINSPQTDPNNTTVQRETEKDELQMKPLLQRREALGGGAASPELESSINQARGDGQPLEAGLQQQMGQAMGADFSGVKVHTDSQADQLNESIQAKAFTTGKDIFFKQGAYQPNNKGGQELIAHELTHVVQQGGSNIQAKPTISVQEDTLQTMGIQRTPEDVWNNVGTLPQVNEKDAKLILHQDFYSNWFLAQEYLLNPKKWTERNKQESEAQQHSEVFKGLMKILLKLRESETNELLTIVRDELKQQKQFQNLSKDEVLKWSAAGSQSLTSDIDVNLKGAGSIPAVGLFNKYFKTKLGWSLDPGTVYDVNVYAQDFMTPKAGKGAPFEKGENEQQPTITPIQEVEELNTGDQSSSLSFDAFAINQDVWSMVKMRIYMTESEWNAYKNEMLVNAKEDSSPDGLARELQVQAQIEDAEGYYQEYKSNLETKIHEIENSGDQIYTNMRSVLTQGQNYLSEHQQEASKKMIAANLIYEEKLKEVTQLRQELQSLKQNSPQAVAKIKEIGIQLKNVLSEAILYSNEAYFTQGAVHFAVIGQQIGKGESKLIMSEDEHLHSFREQVGDTLKVLGEYQDSTIDKAIMKAGKYIDRMAKSAIPLFEGIDPSNDYNKLAQVGAAAAKLKADKTKREELKDQSSLNENETQKLSTLEETVPQQEQQFTELAGKFSSVQELRATVIAVGKQIEKDFRQKQREKNSQNQVATVPVEQPENQDHQLNQIQENIEEADQGLGTFDKILLGLGSLTLAALLFL
ncbi:MULTISPECIES: DUF4157 domain-containing protein [Spirulina sp. CCY15215]|uniref:eCIS core domain-containing protein n=1 Tax=Spirulina sp. CCY15215 TaxID=2767591 RepID=UPI001951D9D5|nr:DUF4157 domain-containing protein [Spirulina major]